MKTENANLCREITSVQRYETAINCIELQNVVSYSTGEHGIARFAALRHLCCDQLKFSKPVFLSGTANPGMRHRLFSWSFAMSRPVVDRIGQRFGAWTVVEYRGYSKWLLRCDCGTERISALSNMLLGWSKSCGCKKHIRNPVPVPQPQPEHVDREFNGQVIRQRTSDRYFDATAMCKIGGKLIGHWSSLQSTTDYLSVLSTVIGIPITELVVVRQGGDHNMQGTWIHPRAAMRLAQWISPEFSVLVDGWVLDLVEGRSSTFGQQASLPHAKTPESNYRTRSISQMPSLEVAEHELKQLERETKIMRCVVSGLKKAQRFMACAD